MSDEDRAQALLHAVKASLQRARLTSFDRIIVAFSGGLDSSVLVDLLHTHYQRGGPAPQLVHVDHKTRQSSADDARFCETEARRRRLPFRLIRLKPNSAHGQISLRRQRLAALAMVALERGAPAIALGHHADDRIETFLLNGLRGAGLRGLSSMTKEDPFPLPQSSLSLLRPLIDSSRAELLSFANHRGLRWIEDPTNRHDHYERNRLRHHALPHLLTSEKDRAGLNRTIHNLATEAQALATYTARLRSTAHTPALGPKTVALDRATLAKSPPATLAHLFLSLEPSLDTKAIDEITAAILARPSRKTTYLTKSRCLFTITRHTVLFEPAHSRGARDLLQRKAWPIQLSPLKKGQAPFLGCRIRWQTLDQETPPSTSDHQDPELLSLILPLNDLHPPLYIAGPPPQIPAALQELFSKNHVDQHLRWRWPCLFDRHHRFIWAAGLAPPLNPSHHPNHDPQWILWIEPFFDIIKNLQQ